MSNYIKALPADVLEEVTEEALNKAFRHVQDKIGVESGDFACAWVCKGQLENFKEWLKTYARAERQFWQDEQNEKNNLTQ